MHRISKDMDKHQYQSKYPGCNKIHGKPINCKWLDSAPGLFIWACAAYAVICKQAQMDKDGVLAEHLRIKSQKPLLKKKERLLIDRCSNNLQQ